MPGTGVDTMDRVYKALLSVGLSETQIMDTVHAVLNHKVIFADFPIDKAPIRLREYVWFVISAVLLFVSFIFDGLLKGNWLHDLFVLVFITGFCYVWDHRQVWKTKK